MGLLPASQELTDFDSTQNCSVAGPCRRTMLPGLPAGPAAFRGWEEGPGAPATPPVRGLCCWGARGVPRDPPDALGFHAVGPRWRGPGRHRDPHPRPWAGTRWRMLSAPLAPRRKGCTAKRSNTCALVALTPKEQRDAGALGPGSVPHPGATLWEQCPSWPQPWLAATGLRLLKQVSVGKRGLPPLATLPVKGSAHAERGWRVAGPTAGLVPRPRLSQPPHRAPCPGPGLAGSWLPGRAGGG